jgi:hypothetical protein
LLAGVDGTPDDHTEQCPTCGALVRDCRRIAAWIAEGKTNHSAPAEWKLRTLARVLASSGPVQSSLEEVVHTADAAAAQHTVARTQVRSLAPSGLLVVPATAPAEAERSRPQLRRRHGALAAAVIAGAAVFGVILMARHDGPGIGLPGTERVRAVSGSDRMELGTESASHPLEVTLPSRQSAPPPQPSRDPLGAAQLDAPAIEAPVTAGQSSRAEPAPIKRRGASRERRGETVDGAEPTNPASRRRAGTVTIDLEREMSSETIEVDIDTVPPGAQVVLDRVILGTTPFHHSLQRSDRERELAIRLDGYVDETVIVGARSVASHIKLVPVPVEPRDPRPPGDAQGEPRDTK